MMKSWRPMVAIAGAVGLFGGIVIAQTAAVTPASEEGRQPVTFGVGLRVEYTDNRDDAEDDKVSTADYYVTPRVDVFLHSDATLFDLYYAPAWRYRSDPSATQNDSELFQALGLDITHDASAQTQLRLKEYLAYQDDPSIEEGGAQVRQNETYWLNRTDAGIQHALNELTRVDLGGGYASKSYTDNDVADQSDEDSVSGTFTAWRQLSEVTAVHGDLGMSAYGYQSQNGLDRDFDSYLFAAGVDHIFSSQFRGGLTGGAQVQEYSDAGLDNQTSPYGRLTAAVVPSAIYRIEGSLGMGARNADVYPFASQEYTEFGLNVTVDPAPTYSLGLQATVRESDYKSDSLPASAVAAQANDSGNETTTGVGVSGTWKINERARLTLAQRYLDVDSDVDTSFTKNTSSIEIFVAL